MGSSKVISILVGILILYISIGWYGNFDYILVEKGFDTYEYPVSYETAKEILVHPIFKDRRYYYKNINMTTYKRTLIPFKYKKIGTTTEKQYYNKN